MRLRHALERESPPEHGADHAVLDQPVRAHALVCIREVRADDLLLAHPEVAHVEVEVVARRAGADDHLAERLDGEHGGGEGGHAYVLEDDVGLLAENLLHALRELARLTEACLLLVLRLAALAHHPRELVAVDVVDGSELLDQLTLLVARDDANAIDSGGLAELHGEHAEPARRAPDERGLAGLPAAARDEHAVGGEVAEAIRGGLLPAQVLPLGEQLLGLTPRELVERPPGRLVAPDLLRRRGERIEAVDLGILVRGLVAVDDDLVTGLPARHAGADLPDDAGGVGAADVVAVLRVVAVAEDRHRLAERGPDVVVVHARGHHPHDHLERARLRNLDLLELEGVRRLTLALLADDPCSHRLRERAGLGVHARNVRHVNSHLSLEFSLVTYRAAEIRRLSRVTERRAAPRRLRSDAPLPAGAPVRRGP